MEVTHPRVCSQPAVSASGGVLKNKYDTLPRGCAQPQTDGSRSIKQAHARAHMLGHMGVARPRRVGGGANRDIIHRVRRARSRSNGHRPMTPEH